MTEHIQSLLKISVLIFMAGNLLDMGLRLKINDVLDGLKRRRFVALTLLWGFVILPSVAWVLTKMLPLSPQHAIGLILLGMTPCAPFLPPMVDRARGNLNLAAVVMMLTAVTTVLYMVTMVPVLAPGLAVTPDVIAKPLVLFMLAPLVIGVIVGTKLPQLVSRIHGPLKLLVTADTLLLLLLCVIIYGEEFLGLFGSYVPLAQLIFFAIAAMGPMLLPLGLGRDEGVVVSLAMATRNLGAALAPLFAAASVPEHAVVTVALGLVMQTAAALISATWFRRRTERVAASRQVIE